MLLPLSCPPRTDNILAKRRRAEHDVRATTGPAAFAARWWYRFNQRHQLGDVVAVAAGQRSGQRDAGGVGDQMMLAA